MYYSFDEKYNHLMKSIGGFEKWCDYCIKKKVALIPSRFAEGKKHKDLGTALLAVKNKKANLRQ